jgi:photosystem II stability/assembly factor-like uncharacterized protein
MRKVSRRSPAWLVLGGLLVVTSPLLIHLSAQGFAAGQPSMGDINTPDNPMLQGFHWRAIGPVGQGSRVADYAVDEKNPSTYYVGYAKSGVWKTTNNGTTFAPIFTTYGVGSIGDLALAPTDSNILYVGTGENNNRQTTSFGNGLYKSTDAGKTFTRVGPAGWVTIGRIVVSPKNPDTVWVAVPGHLYGPDPDRGVYMTTDGGKTWNKTLFVDENTGASDLIVDPSNPNYLWASTYERRRHEWGFVGGGPGSGLWASTDGGKTWKRLSGDGLPNGTMGRIALDICKTKPNVIYTQIEVALDHQPPLTAAQKQAQADALAAAQAQRGRGAGGGGFGGGGGRGRGGPPPPPNPQASGVWKSVDHGKTWQFMSNQDMRPMYFSQIRVDPNNADVVYTGGLDAYKSTDGGKTWETLSGKGHVDNHAIWIDPNNSQHVMYGDDGGMDISWDGGQTWQSPRLSPVGLAYHVSVNMDHPYWVCTGLQDNGSWCGPSSVRGPAIRSWNWISVGGGDGFQNQMDPNDPNVFYTESQNLGIQRYDLSTGQTQSIKPRGARGGRGGGGGGFGGGGRSNIVPEPAADTVMAFNWNSPIRLSPFDSNTVYVGGRQLFVSPDQGQTWRMSPSLGKDIDTDTRSMMGQSYGLPTCGNSEGAAGGRSAGPGEPCIISKHDGYTQNEFGTLTEIAVSPVVPGVVWAGTDDGNVQVSKDDGRTFTEVGKNIPGVNHEYYVSGLEASWFDAGTAYVALDGHRDDDLKPYVFKTTDYGQTWKSVSGNLPAGNVNSIRQDPVNANLLFAPTEFGFYVSLNDGGSWSKFMPGLPDGQMDEVVVHPREHDLVLATRSYSAWIMDDITALEQATDVSSKPATLFTPRDAVLWKNDPRQRTEVPGDAYWGGENAPRGTAIAYYLKNPASDVKVTITNTATGQEVYACTGSKTVGMNRFQWELTGMGGGGRGGRGGRAGGGGAAVQGGAAGPPAAPTTPACSGQPGGGGRRGGGGFGRGGGGGIEPGVYKVTLTVNGVDAGSETFKLLEDVWMK